MMFGKFSQPQGIVPSESGSNGQGPRSRRSEHTFFWALGLPFMSLAAVSLLSKWIGFFPAAIIIGIVVGLVYSLEALAARRQDKKRKVGE